MSRLRKFFDRRTRRGALAIAAPIFLLLFSGEGLAAQAFWSAVGPAGGDARAFAAVAGQPNHLYLGTTHSWVYETLDQGATWRRLVRLDEAEDLILDNILVDATNPTIVFAGGWKADQKDGGLWVSRDGGRRWSVVDGLKGQSLFALAQAPSNPAVLYAGTLEGVFRSTDGGASWGEISPRGSREIHEVESLAVDPLDPNVVYAGTWHLPWKTEDGGKNWHSIKDGLIDDSDVFSIILDPASPRTVFLSACSGIYKSEDGGELFHKIQGIPSTARRTRVLMQDPENREVVYAGTTEGLYKTMDGGRSFQRLTGPDVVVNDVFVDPRDGNRVLVATDRGGVLASRDGGGSFAAANEGISGRTVEALLVDRKDPARILAGVVNDKNYGGVFVSIDGGMSWSQTGEGLDGRDVFALAQAPDGTVLAGTSHGVFALDADTKPVSGQSWRPRNTLAIGGAATEKGIGGTPCADEKKQAQGPKIEMESRVNALDLTGDVWAAATSIGIVTSRDRGASWQGGPVMGLGEYVSVAAKGTTIAAARNDAVVLSNDGGWTWLPMTLPAMVTRIHRVAFSADGTLWLGAREGVFLTRNLGRSWSWMERLPFRDVDDVYFDPGRGKVLVSSRASDQVYAIDPKTLQWEWRETGYRIGLIRAAGDRLAAASLHDGVLVAPPPSADRAVQK